MTDNVKGAVAEALGIFYRDHLEPRLDRIERKQSEHDEKFKDILGHFDQLYQRLTRLEDEYQTIIKGLRRIEVLLESDQARRNEFERRVDELKRQVGELQVKVTELEQHISA